jgi:hypothetical protein
MFSCVIECLSLSVCLCLALSQTLALNFSHALSPFLSQSLSPPDYVCAVCGSVYRENESESRKEGGRERERECAREREGACCEPQKKKQEVKFVAHKWKIDGDFASGSVLIFLDQFFWTFRVRQCVCMHVCLCMCDCACVFHTHTCTHTHIQYRQPDLCAQVQRGGVGCSVQVRNRAQLDDLRGLRVWLHRRHSPGIY